jgi:hypothetical protein
MKKIEKNGERRRKDREKKEKRKKEKKKKRKNIIEGQTKSINRITTL